MDTLPIEIYLNEITLDYKGMINLNQVNHYFYKIYQDDTMWKKLLYQDLGIKQNLNHKYFYMLYKSLLIKLTKLHPIITQSALLKIVECIPISEWDDLCMILEDHVRITSDYILSINYIKSALSGFKYEYENNKDFKLPTIYQYKINCKYENVDILCDDIEKNRNKFTDIVSTPSYIFVDERLILCKYDLELAEQIVGELTSHVFYVCDCIDDIIEELNKLRIVKL